MTLWGPYCHPYQTTFPVQIHTGKWYSWASHGFPSWQTTCWFVSWAFHFIWQTTFYTFKSSPFPWFLPSLTICVLRYSHSLYTHTHTHTHTHTTLFLIISRPHRTTRKPSQSSTYCFHSQYVLWVTPPTHIILILMMSLLCPVSSAYCVSGFVPYCLTLGNYISDHMTSWLLLTFWALIKWIQYLCSEQSKS